MSHFSSSGVAQPSASIDPSTRYVRLGSLSWLHFLNDGSANYLPGILPVVLITLHVSVSLAGTVMSALLIGQNIFPENRSLGSGIAMGLSNGPAAVLLAVFSLIPALHSPQTALWVLVGTVALAGLIGLELPEHHPATAASATTLP